MTYQSAEKIFETLGEQERAEGTLPLSLEIYRRFLSVQSDVRRQIQVPALKLDKKSASDKIRSGQPLLDFEDLSIDEALFQKVFERILSVIKEYPQIFRPLPDEKSQNSDLMTAAKNWFDGEPLKDTGYDSDVLKLAIQMALKPFLSAGNEAAFPFFNQEEWRRNYCPFCGGSPDFAFLDKEKGARHLICSRCDADWLFQRIGCSECGNDDQNTLSYFSDDSGMYRLYVCEQCKGYLKAIDLRHAEKEIMLPLERFNTLDLDAQACRDGYHAQNNARHVKSSRVAN